LELCAIGERACTDKCRAQALQQAQAQAQVQAQTDGQQNPGNDRLMDRDQALWIEGMCDSQTAKG